jgi:hypothetical protein
MEFPAFDSLTERESLRCAEIANAFSEQEELWSRYRHFVAQITDICFDLEISGEEATNYLIFVGNTVRLWFRKIAPDVEASHRMFEHFHRLIEQKAKAAVGLTGRSWAGDRLSRQYSGCNARLAKVTCRMGSSAFPPGETSVCPSSGGAKSVAAAML